MQENNFERDVQRTMAELNIQPSGDVWNNLDKLLREKKRKRYFIYAALLTGILLIGSVITFYFQNEKTKTIGEGTEITGSAEPHNQDKVNDNKHTDLVKNDSLNDDLRNNVAGKDAVVSKSRTASNSPVKNDADNNELTNDEVKKDVWVQGNAARTGIAKDPVYKHATNKGGRDQPVVTAKTPDKISIEKNRVDLAVADKVAADKAVTEKIIRDESVADKVIADKAGADKVITGNPAVTPDSLAGSSTNSTAAVQKDTAIITLKIQEPDTLSNTVVAIPPKTITSYRLKWKLDISAGISSMRSLPQGFGAKKSLSMADQNLVGSSMGFPLAPAIIIEPSDISPGLSFRIGAGAEKQISKRSSLFAGLSYEYYSNRIQVGHYTVNTFLGNSPNSLFNQSLRAYSGSPDQTFTNKYHIISVPLQYQLKINPDSKLPFQWNSGVRVGYLISEDALVYDRALGGIYYRDEDAYHRFRFNVSTGIDLQFGRGRLVRWSLGPELSLNLNKLISSGYDDRQYMTYGGLTGKFYFRN